MSQIPEHPIIAQMERFGYIREPEYLEPDEDWEYEEKRERELFENA